MIPFLFIIADSGIYRNYFTLPLEYYPYTIGIKTGYTAKAGPCLIARAKHNNKDILLIILHSDRGKRWEISKEYFDNILKVQN
ncbi:MAG: hypothetical protein KN64_09595 [Sulfurovum sp. AS07-7]|nr:MAG: hypothetical protein KN64_09595 [Sulfurovum sp. AS07-7]